MKIFSKSININICVYISTMFFFSSLFAQSANSNFTHYTQEDGLPSSQIHHILQDHLGYIWIGSISGLARFDGYEFTQFMKDVEDSASIQTELVSSLYEDKNGNIWIGSVFGMSMYNNSTGTFTNHGLSSVGEAYIGKVLRVEAIAEDALGNLIIGLNEQYYSEIEKGLYHFEDGELKPYQFGDAPEQKNIFDLMLDSRGLLWSVGFAGLYSYDIRKKTVKHYPLPIPGNQGSPTALEEDLNGNICVATHKFGVFIVNPDDGTYEHYLHNFLDDKFDNNLTIWDLQIDTSGKLWIASTRGLIYLDPVDGRTLSFLPDSENKNSLQTHRLSSLMIDFAGSVWIGSWNAGMSRFDPGRSYFTAFTPDHDDPKSLTSGWANCLFEDRTGNIWIGSIKRVINRFNRKNKTFEKFPKDTVNMSQNLIITAYADGDNNIWVGTFGNNPLAKFSPGLDRVVPVESFKPPSQTTINAFLEDQPGYLWIGTNSGLFLYNTQKGTSKQFTFDSLENGSLASNNVNRLILDKRAQLWIGTDNGVFRSNKEKSKFERLGIHFAKSSILKDQDINSVYADTKDNIWVGTWRAGLNRYNPDLDTLTSFTMKDGLASNSIQGILGDEENNALWLSTFEGITKLDLKTNRFTNYDINDGIHAKQYADGAALKTSKGEFIFGGAGGITYFTSEDIKENIIPPKVLITDFKLFNNSIKPNASDILYEPIFKTNEVILEHDQNDITLDYLALHFFDPQRNQYAYKLENYQNEWRNVGSQQTAIFPNLPPGKYTFKVKASNNYDVWNNEGASVKLTILPPWWRTAWAYFSYILFIAGLVFTVDRFQRRRLVQKERAAAAIKEAELRAQVAEAENARKTRELEEARQLQLSMLPKNLPQLPHLDIAVYMKTATEVGGDYYDFHVSMDGTLTVVIGDATGHGMKAGTMVTTAKSLFNSYAPNPDIVYSFQEITRCIKEMRFDKLSMCMTMLKIKGNSLKISTAGMPSVFVFRNNKSTVDEFLLEGMPLGSISNFTYKVQDTMLDIGDTILLMTDGFPELQNDAGELYGYKQVLRSFKKVAKKKPEEIIEYLKNEGLDWGKDKDPDDDITFLVIKSK